MAQIGDVPIIGSGRDGSDRAVRIDGGTNRIGGWLLAQINGGSNRTAVESDRQRCGHARLKLPSVRMEPCLGFHIQTATLQTRLQIMSKIALQVSDSRSPQIGGANATQTQLHARFGALLCASPTDHYTSKRLHDFRCISVASRNSNATSLTFWSPV